MKQMMIIAHKELSDYLRNGWIVAIALIFSLFALVISLAGFGFTGSVGMAGEQTTLLSLTSLVIYLIPLLGLILGYASLSGEQEQGTLDLLYCYPVVSRDIVLGKWLGLSAVLALAISSGLMVPASIAIYAGHSILPWLSFTLLSIWMGMIFIGLAILLSTSLWERTRLLGLVLGVWLLFTVLFDVGLMGLMVMSSEQLSADTISFLFYCNPTSLFRFLNIRLLFDPSVLQQMGWQSQVPSVQQLVVALCFWTIVPVVFSSYRMQHK
jgi:Cu-processing system permease protein